MKITQGVLNIEGKSHKTDDILNIYSLGEKTVGMQEYYSMESYQYNSTVDEIYKELRQGGCKNFFKIEDMVFNLDYVDSYCIQMHPNLRDKKGAYALMVTIQDGSKHRFAFETHIEAERYFKAMDIAKIELEEKHKEINV